jgi:hypothetical protein
MITAQTMFRAYIILLVLLLRLGLDMCRSGGNGPYISYRWYRRLRVLAGPQAGEGRLGYCIGC